MLARAGGNTDRRHETNLDLLRLYSPLRPFEMDSFLRVLKLVQDVERDPSEIVFGHLTEQVRACFRQGAGSLRSNAAITISVVVGHVFRDDFDGEGLLEEGQGISGSLDEAVRHRKSEQLGRVDGDGGSNGRQIDGVDECLGAVLVCEMDQPEAQEAEMRCQAPAQDVGPKRCARRTYDMVSPSDRGFPSLETRL